MSPAFLSTERSLNPSNGGGLFFSAAAGTNADDDGEGDLASLLALAGEGSGVDNSSFSDTAALKRPQPEAFGLGFKKCTSTKMSFSITTGWPRINAPPRKPAKLRIILLHFGGFSLRTYALIPIKLGERKFWATLYMHRCLPYPRPPMATAKARR